MRLRLLEDEKEVERKKFVRYSVGSKRLYSLPRLIPD
jgi:hypothetical protein